MIRRLIAARVSIARARREARHNMGPYRWIRLAFRVAVAATLAYALTGPHMASHGAANPPRHLDIRPRADVTRQHATDSRRPSHRHRVTCTLARPCTCAPAPPGYPPIPCEFGRAPNAPVTAITEDSPEWDACLGDGTIGRRYLRSAQVRRYWTMPHGRVMLLTNHGRVCVRRVIRGT